MAITAPQVETQACAKCSVELPITDFVRANSKSGYTRTCKPCMRVYKRERDAAKRAAGIHVPKTLERVRLAEKRELLGWKQVDEAPGSPEIVLLRGMLAAARRGGHSFDDVWDRYVPIALRELPKRHRETAAEVLAWAKPHFRAGYERRDVCRLDPTLLNALSGTRSEHELAA